MQVVCHCLKNRVIVSNCLRVVTQAMLHIASEEYYNSPLTEILLDMLEERHPPPELPECLEALFASEDS